MGPIKRNTRKRRLSLLDRVALRRSTHRQIDGLWIGAFGHGESVLGRVEEALALIKTHDRLRYDRITRDLERVWVRMVIGGVGQFSESLGACELDERFVLDATTTPARIAATIVHEATHARLQRRGVAYEEKLRARVEAVCFRRELAFANKLPDGAEVREDARCRLELAASNDYWTDAAFSTRHADEALQAAIYVGIPPWLVRILLALRAVATSISRGLRRQTKLAAKN